MVAQTEFAAILLMQKWKCHVCLGPYFGGDSRRRWKGWDPPTRSKLSPLHST